MVRSLTLAALVMGVSGGAFAADLGAAPLRGALYDPPASGNIWEGAYAGVFAGWGTGTSNFKNAAKGQIETLMRQTDLETEQKVSTLALPTKSTTNGPHFGAYAGYNWAFEDSVFGIEADYQRTNYDFSAKGDASRVYALASGYNANFSYNATDKAKVENIATARVRIGYAMGNVLPFITFGAAFAHGQRATSVNIPAITYYDPNPATYSSSVVCAATCSTVTTQTYFPKSPYTVAARSASIAKTNQFGFGFAGGFGADYAITPNVLVRAEYQFAKVGFGGADVVMSSARAGVAAKF
jgi:outer membrane immunogenic protein